MNLLSLKEITLKLPFKFKQTFNKPFKSYTSRLIPVELKVLSNLVFFSASIFKLSSLFLPRNIFGKRKLACFSHNYFKTLKTIIRWSKCGQFIIHFQSYKELLLTKNYLKKLCFKRKMSSFFTSRISEDFSQKLFISQ